MLPNFSNFTNLSLKSVCSVLQHLVLSLGVSDLQKPMLPLDISILQQPVLPWTAWTNLHCRLCCLEKSSTHICTLASRPMPPASVYRNPASQSGTAAFRYRTDVPLIPEPGSPAFRYFKKIPQRYEYCR
jgi:hypothetical protein